MVLNNTVKKKSLDVLKLDKWILLILPISILILWVIVSELGIFPEAILPTVEKVIESAKVQISTGALFNDIGISLFRVIKGFAIAAVLGVGLGILIGVSDKVDKFFFFTFNAIRQIPMLAWIPLVVLWFGIGETSKVIVIVLAAFFPILLNTTSGIKRTDYKLVEVGNMYKLSKLSLLRKIYLPSALPSIFVGLKLGVGISWMAVVGAEIIAASSGIGFRMNDARSLMQPEVVFVSMIGIAVIGILMDQILSRISKKVIRWELR